MLILLLIRNILLCLVYFLPAFFIALAAPQWLPLLLLFGGALWLQLRLFQQPVSPAEAVMCWLVTLLVELGLAAVAWQQIGDIDWAIRTADRNLAEQAGIAFLQLMSQFIWLPLMVFVPFVPWALLRTFLADDTPVEPEPKYWLLPRERRVALLLLGGHALMALDLSLSSVLLLVLGICYFFISRQPVTWRYAVRTCAGSLLVCGGLSTGSVAISHFVQPTSEGTQALLLLAGILSPGGTEHELWFWPTAVLNAGGATWLLRRLWQTRPAAAEA